MPSSIQYSKHITSNESLELKLEAINICVREHYINEDKIGVLEGLSGIALFQFYYARFSDNDLYADWGQETLVRIIELINAGFNLPTFSSGISGAGWTLNHLKNNDFIDIDIDDLLQPLDEYLFQTMNESLNVGYLDFLHGASGTAFYFLERYKSTTNSTLKQTYYTYINHYIDTLSKLAIKDSNGLKWKSQRSFRDTSLGVDLSLSHGVSSLISTLCTIAKGSVFIDTCKPLIENAIHYVLSQELDHKLNSTSLFPNWISETGEKDSNTRLGWCYGDFSVAIACYKASKILDDKTLLNKAHQILKHTTLRINEEDTQVIDAGLCHGAFGNAQIYNYVFKDSRVELYKDASNYWLALGLEMGSFEDGYVGFKQHFGQGKWESMLTLLEGVSGIGLSIIDHLSEEKNHWDKCIQLG